MSVDERIDDDVARDGYVVADSGLDCVRLCERVSALIVQSAESHLRGELPSLDFWTLMPLSVDRAITFWDAGVDVREPVERWERHAMRVGHGLHLVDAEIAAACSSLPAFGTQIVQSAVVYKQPQSDAVQFGLHQDSWYLSSEPDTLMLAFVALDDMDVENGCLEVVPGSHRLPRTETLTLTARGFVSVSGSQRRPPDGAIPLPMQRGQVAFLTGRTFHGSAPNRSPRPRRALIVHMLGAESRMLPSSWVQSPPTTRSQ